MTTLKRTTSAARRLATLEIQPVQLQISEPAPKLTNAELIVLMRLYGRAVLIDALGRPGVHGLSGAWAWISDYAAYATNQSHDLEDAIRANGMRLQGVIIPTAAVWRIVAELAALEVRAFGALGDWRLRAVPREDASND